MEDYINPIRSYTDEDGTWWMEFKEKDVKELFRKHKVKQKKRWQFWR
jgi:hypothetical protein